MRPGSPSNPRLRCPRLRASASTPVAFSLLLRPPTILGDQAPRLVPLAFSAASVIVGVLLAGSLPWPTRSSKTFACSAVGLAVLLTPAMLVRNDLKQYTADVFFTLLAFYLCSRLESHWTVERLAALAAVAAIGPLISIGSSSAGFACLAALLLVRVVRRDRSGALRAGLAGCGALLVSAALYAATTAPNITSAFHSYWKPYFLDGSVGNVVSTAWTHFRNVDSAIGLGPTALVLAWVLAGLVTLVLLDRSVLAVAFVGLWLEMGVLGALDAYPFVDLRTSTFLLVVTAVVGMIGVAGVRGRALHAVASGTCLVCSDRAGAVAPGCRPPHSPIGVAGRGCARPGRVCGQAPGRPRRRPRELSGSYGFAYYWDQDEVSFRRDPSAGPGYLPVYGSARIVVAEDREPGGVEQALSAAIDVATAHQGRVWLVRSHVVPAEADAWLDAAARLGVTIEPVCMQSPAAGDSGRDACKDAEPPASSSPAETNALRQRFVR